MGPTPWRSRKPRESVLTLTHATAAISASETGFERLAARNSSAGPSALYAYMGPKWKIGGLLQQYFSYAGPDSRDDVNLTNIQYFVYYSLNDTISIGAGPNIIANWEADSDNRWTVPIGLGINRTFQFGKVPVRIGAEFHYNVVRPDTVGADWDLRIFIIPAAPSALFGWMQ